MSEIKIKQPKIDATFLKKTLGEKSDCMVLDVRTPGEYRNSRIKGSINIPLSEISVSAKRIIPNMNSAIFVYCLSGARSAKAVEILTELGYSNTFNVENGLLGWRALDYPLES